MHAPSHVVAALRALRAGAVALVATLALGLPNARAEVVIIDSIGWTDTTVGPYEPIGIYAAGWMSETFVGLDCAVYDVCNDWFELECRISGDRDWRPQCGRGLCWICYTFSQPGSVVGKYFVGVRCYNCWWKSSQLEYVVCGSGGDLRLQCVRWQFHDSRGRTYNWIRSNRRR